MNQLTMRHKGYSGDPSWYKGVSMRFSATTTPITTRKPAKIRFIISTVILHLPLQLFVPIR